MSMIRYKAFYKNKMMEVVTIDFANQKVMVRDGLEHYYVSNDKIMQGTGFLDKNGIEVFEGDLIKLGHEWSGLDAKYVCHHGGFMSFSVVSEKEIEYIKKGSNHFKYWDTDDTNVYLLNQLEECEVEIIGNMQEKPRTYGMTNSTKSCTKCGNTQLVELETYNEKRCLDCHTVIVWHLSKGQKPRK